MDYWTMWAFSFILLAVMGGCGWAACRAWQTCRQGGRYLALFLLSGVLCLLEAVLARWNMLLPLQIDLAMLLKPFLSPLWFLFLLQVVRNRFAGRWWVMLLLAVEPVLMLFSAGRELWQEIHLLYCAALTLLGLGVLVVADRLVPGNRPYRRELLLVLTLLLWGTLLLPQAELAALVIAGSGLAAFCFCLEPQANGLFAPALVKIASESQAGILLLDTQQRIVYANLTAQILLDVHCASGQPLVEAAPALKKLQGSLKKRRSQLACEVALPITGRRLKLVADPLKDSQGSAVGFMLVLHDLAADKKNPPGAWKLETRLRCMQVIQQAILTTTSPSEVAVTTLRQARLLLPCCHASVVMLDLLHDEAEVLVLFSNRAIYPVHMFRSLGDYNLPMQLKQGRPYIVYGLHNQPRLSLYEAEMQEENVNAFASWPLTAHGSLMGLLTLGFEDASVFTPEYEAVMAELASILAVGLESTRRSHFDQRYKQELEALNATVEDILSELELPRLLRAILARAMAIMGASSGELSLYHEKQRMLEIVVSFGLKKDYTGTFLALGEGATGRVAQTLQPLMIDDYTEWQGNTEIYQDEPTFNGVLVPLIAGGHLLGVFAVGGSDPQRRFGAEDIEMLNHFGRQASIAVRNALLFDMMERRAVEAEMLRLAGVTLSSSLNQREVLENILEQLSRVIAYESAAVFLWLDQEKELELVGGRAPSGVVLETGQRFPIQPDSPADQVWQRRQPVIINNITQTYPNLLLDFHRDVQSWMGTPLMIQGRMLGLLSLGSRELDAFDPEQARISSAFATHVSLALENARLYAESQRLAVTDPLTGLYNRRHFFEVAEAELDRILRYRHPLSLMMLDIDHFKLVNDTYGHISGDQVLQSLAKRCRLEMREVDILGRFGGEEFVILLPETGLAFACEAAERLRKHIAEQPPVHTARGDISFTVSIGVAALDQQPIPLDVLLDRADQAMYAAKQAGRNRVLSWDSLQKNAD